MRCRHLARLLSLLAVAAPALPAAPLDIPGFMAIPRPLPTGSIRYGAAPVQAIDLFLPARHRSPAPVVILIHGGRWSSRTAAREQVRHLGADLAARGIATWSIGYRRADEEGGGYPGTYEDIGTAIDRLRSEAPRLGLDLSRVVLVGHSAGGHLALWAASRDRLPAHSALRMDDPFVFCTQGQDVRKNPMPCWKPMPPFTGAFMLMPYCRPPNPYGKDWTQDDTLSFAQYKAVCPKAIESGRWEGGGRPENTPIRH